MTSTEREPIIIDLDGVLNDVQEVRTLSSFWVIKIRQICLFLKSFTNSKTQIFIGA